MQSTNATYRELGLSSFGPATFAKGPLVTLDQDWSADIGVLGVPFDQGAGFRSGARWGSKAIRDMSVRFSSISAESRPGYWDLRTRRDKAICSLVDCGDVDIVPLLWEQNFDLITNATRAIRMRETIPFVMGGDHSITFPVMRAFEGSSPLTIVHFDAHMDYRDEVMGVRFGHGNVLRRVRELPFVKHMISIGIRSMRTRKEDFEASERHGNTVIAAWDVHAKGPDHFVSVLPQKENVYITFDIDAMDPAIAPGTGTPEVGGLSFEQARRFLEIVCEHNRIVGFDLVEMNPSYDPTYITALLSAQLMVEAIGFMFPRC